MTVEKGHIQYMPPGEPLGVRCCWTCQHFHGHVRMGAGHILCFQGGISTKSFPDKGCAFWRREPGADDEIHYSAERREQLGWDGQVYDDPPELVAKIAEFKRSKRRY
jgi:hypothetical protein